jgi:pimeloyl-ACP methyl ester carboxylesterase
MAVSDGVAEIAEREVHYRQYGREFSGVPLVFLHEGLGSVELWRDFPGDVATSSRRPGVAYSRYGNGRSSPLAQPRHPDYMHEEAQETLPRLVDELVGEAPILVGHSDGASIAIIYAGAGHPVEGLVLIAPHVFVEPENVRSISAIRDRFSDSDLAAKMAKYHTDPEATFYGWADVWLSPAFRSWNIEEYLPGVHSPTFLIQGDADEYGTVRQLDAIDAGLGAPTDRLIVASAGHSPHLSHPELVTDAVVEFLSRVTA